MTDKLASAVKVLEVLQSHYNGGLDLVDSDPLEMIEDVLLILGE